MAIIMRFFSHLFLLSCIFVEYSSTINNTNYILCTSHCSQIILSFNDSLQLPPECQETTDVTNIYEYGLACGIDYRINYDEEKIYIDFQVTNDTGSLEDQPASEFLVQSIWLSLDNNQNNRPNEITRKYGCNTKKDCAREFYLNTITNFVNDASRTKLDLIKEKLYNEAMLVGPESRRRCTDSSKVGNKTSKACKSGFCYARLETYDLNEQQDKKLQKCEINLKAFLFSESEHHTPKSTKKEREILEYRCNKNVCNRNDLILKIGELIREYTQHNSIQEPTQLTEEKTIKSLSIRRTISSYAFFFMFILRQLFT